MNITTKMNETIERSVTDQLIDKLIKEVKEPPELDGVGEVDYIIHLLSSELTNLKAVLAPVSPKRGRLELEDALNKLSFEFNRLQNILKDHRDEQ